MSDIEFIVVSVLGSAALVVMMIATARVNRSLSDGLRHKWKYHNPYDRTCSRCMRHEVKHCRSMETWNRGWWEVFFEGYGNCPPSGALDKTLKTLSSKWMDGVKSAERDIASSNEENLSLISSNYRVVDRLAALLRIAIETEFDFDCSGVRDIDSSEYFKGYQERLLLELNRLGYDYDINLGAVPHVEQNSSEDPSLFPPHHPSKPLSARILRFPGRG